MSKKVLIFALMLSLLFLSGCAVFSTDDYLVGEIEGTLATGTLRNYGCYKVGNIVTASARYFDLDDESTNIACFQLPKGFRPRVDMTCNGYIVVNNNIIPTFIKLNTDGVVSVAYSNHLTMSEIYFSATFPAS